jgi:hypothetical protein
VAELLAKLAGTVLLTLLIKGGVALFQHSIASWLAALIAAVVVFGGVLILEDGDISSWWD